MFVALLVIFILSLLGLIACLALRTALIRAAEDRHGLSSARDAITEARKVRMTEHALSTELAGKIKEQRRKLAEIEIELKKAQQQVALLPKQVFEIVFELGTPDPGMQAYEFIVARNRRAQKPGEFQGPEAELWARPRILRAWSRNQTVALTLAQSRFSSLDGFMLRVAERVDRTALSSDQRA
jgi:hypothetical protein